ncbi:hypothetical protein [[Eubacterium] cellulosolvens]
MYCERCGVTVPEGREACMNCGARIYPPQAYTPQIPNAPNVYGAFKQHELRRTQYRIIGIILIVIGIILTPIAVMTIFIPIGWLFLAAAGICIMAGIITVATNLSPKPVA